MGRCTECGEIRTLDFVGLCHQCWQAECDREFEAELQVERKADALDRWARRYDDLNGAPESDEDR